MIDGMHTTSLTVAEYFGKRHKDVLRDIRRLGCSQAFWEQQFTLRDQPNEPQNGKPLPYYRMTREGFLFLALAYRGAKAARIREAFIADPTSYPDDLLWENTHV